MRNIFVHATVNPMDKHLVEKQVATAFIREASIYGDPNVVSHVNKHDYFSWLLSLPYGYRREVKTNITEENWIFPVSVDLNHILDVESEFWTDLRQRFEPLPDKNIIVSISEKAALMLNGTAFDKFFNHSEYSPCISDIWECGPQMNIDLDHETSLPIWKNFTEKCLRYLMPAETYKHSRFYIKCNSSDEFGVYLQKQGIDFEPIALEYFLYDTFKQCSISSPKAGKLMDWEDALDDEKMTTEEILNLIWTDDKQYNAMWLNRMPKEHRVQALVKANMRDLLDDMIWSCGWEEDTPKPPETDKKTNKLLTKMPKQAEHEPHSNRADGHPLNAKHDRAFNLKWLLESRVNIVAESQARDILLQMEPPQPVRFLTEKIFKPMAYGMPCMVIGNKNSLQRLRELGFKTFPEWFDESYDTLDNYSQRTEAMLDSYEKFLSEEHSIEEIRGSLEHNFNRITDRFWVMSRMVDPIRIMWDAIELKREVFK
mgnify:FL=1|tara:strand:+ start:1155 stop:2606 length:1452 start_codon:yes stop_codon:yes gene_type:complete